MSFAFPVEMKLSPMNIGEHNEWDQLGEKKLHSIILLVSRDDSYIKSDRLLSAIWMISKGLQLVNPYVRNRET